MKKIGVIGLWHLGSVLCAAWSKLGYKVIGFDYEKKRVDKLLNGIPPVFEPELNTIINNGLKNNSDVDPVFLEDSGLIRSSLKPIKILGKGELNKKLTVSASAFSESAKAKIQEAGGEIIIL